MSTLTPGRVATALAVIAGICGAATPAVANMDVSSTVGVATGTLAAVAAITKWLTGWQQHEARQATSPSLNADLDDTAGAHDHPQPAPATGELEQLRAELAQLRATPPVVAS